MAERTDEALFKQGKLPEFFWTDWQLSDIDTHRRWTGSFCPQPGIVNSFFLPPSFGARRQSYR
jgi:hypothetical protein